MDIAPIEIKLAISKAILAHDTSVRDRLTINDDTFFDELFPVGSIEILEAAIDNLVKSKEAGRVYE